MPTSSQALVWLKQVRDVTPTVQWSTVTSNQLFGVCPRMPEDSIPEESTLEISQNQVYAVSYPTLGEEPLGRSFTGGSVTSYVPLPPIPTSPRQPSTRDYRVTEAASGDGQLELTAGDMTHFECGDGDVETNISSEEVECLEQYDNAEVMRDNTSGLTDYTIPCFSPAGPDVPYQTQNEYRYISSCYEEQSIPVISYSPGISREASKMNFPADEKIYPQQTLKNRNNLLACLLSASLSDQARSKREDHSSCMGILSYNHQTGRHVWNLVPQKVPPPYRVVRGGYIRKGKHSVGYSTETCPHNQNSRESTQQVSFPNFSFYDELSKKPTGTRTLGCLNPYKSDENPTKETDKSSEYSSHCSVTADNDSFNNWRNEEHSTSNNTQEELQYLQKIRYSNLRFSGIIDNQSYLFNEHNSETEEPRFLDSLITAPQQRGVAEESMSSLLSYGAPKRYPYYDCKPPPTLNHKCCSSRSRTFTGLTPEQKEKAKSIALKKVSLPTTDLEPPRLKPVAPPGLPVTLVMPAAQVTAVPPARQVSPVTPESPVMSVLTVSPEIPAAQEVPETPVLPVTSHAPTDGSSELSEKSHELANQGPSDQQTTPLNKSQSNISFPAQPKVIRMRSELPPRHPNRLCFRTSLPGCTHAEVISAIESKKNAKVTWLQYEPISLHYTDVARAEYRHMCMWLFELSPDSDTTRLLLEGFKLRGHHMNVLHLDDVYLEEFRTFNLCNEIYMEQQSKNLIRHKLRNFLKSARII